MENKELEKAAEEACIKILDSDHYEDWSYLNKPYVEDAKRFFIAGAKYALAAQEKAFRDICYGTPEENESAVNKVCREYGKSMVEILEEHEALKWNSEQYFKCQREGLDE